MTFNPGGSVGLLDKQSPLSTGMQKGRVGSWPQEVLGICEDEAS